MVDSDDELVQARGVGLRFAEGKEALREVDLTIHRGEFVSILGRSGCGKTTLLRLVAGLLEATSGAIELAGARPAEARQKTVRLGYVFQDGGLLPWRSVSANVRLPLELCGVERSQQPAIASRALAQARLTGCDDLYPRQLSGGMKMRAALRALANEPELLLLDEPFAALDALTRAELNRELLGLWSRERNTVVLVTHNIFDAVLLSQRVVVLDGSPGRVVADRHVPLAYPRSLEVQADVQYHRLVQEMHKLLGTEAMS